MKNKARDYSIASSENSYSKWESLDNESGIYLLLVAIMSVALFFVVGLGIDGGRLFLRGLDQQRAADAAAISGAYFIGSGKTQAEIESISHKVAQDNFNQNGLFQNSIGSTFDVVADLASQQVKVTASNIPTSFVIGSIVPGAKHNLVSMDATARRQNIAVDIVMDVTGSMQWAAVDENGVPLNPYTSKLQLAKQALDNFIAHFNQSDRLGLVTYSTSVTIQYPIIAPFAPSILRNIIRDLDAGGGTNIALGLAAGLYDMEKLDPVQYPTRVILLITDGTPNYNSTDDWNQFQTSSFVPYDVSQTTSLTNTFPGFPPRPNNAACRGNHNGEGEVHRQNFVDTMHIANQIRARGIKLVTVAIGPKETTVSPQNPWGTSNVWNTGFIRENFMRWLANDAEAAADNSDLGFPPQCASTYEELEDQQQPQGLGIVEQNTANIDGVLQTVANYLTLQIIE